MPLISSLMPVPLVKAISQSINQSISLLHIAAEDWIDTFRYNKMIQNKSKMLIV